MEYHSCLQQLLERLPALREAPDVRKLVTAQATLTESLDCWDRLVCDPATTLHVAGTMRPALLQIVSNLVDKHCANAAEPHSSSRLQPQVQASEAAFCVALVTMLEVAPHINRLVLQYFEHQPSPMVFLLSMNGTSWHEQMQQSQQTQTTLPTPRSLAYAGLLAVQLAPELGSMWGTAPFLQLVSHSCHHVRWTAVQALAQLLNMSCSSKSHLLDQVLTPQQLVDATAAWHTDRAAAQVEMAAAWLPDATQPVATLIQQDTDGVVATQTTAVPDDAAAALHGSRGKKRRSEQSALQQVPASALESGQPPLPPARSFVNISGIDLPFRSPRKHSLAGAHASGGPKQGGSSTASAAKGHSAGLQQPNQQQHPFVATPTVIRNMRAAALALCSNRPLLLEGPPGSGKTALLEELASRTGNAADMVRIHLDDQMDAKALLGAYMCTAVPGEFTWQPGPLTQAVTEGRWLLVEDINMAPPDVLAALVPLLETGTLTVASRGEVLHAAPGFQLLATVTSAPSASGGSGGGAYATSNMAKELLGGLWAYVRVEPVSEVEQLSLLAAAYPTATSLLPAGIATLHLVQLAAGHREAARKLPSTAMTAAAVGADFQTEGSSGWWWQNAASAALAAAGLKPGELALALACHFSLRDLFKWAGRLHALHATSLSVRSMKKLSSAVDALAKSVKQSSVTHFTDDWGSNRMDAAQEAQLQQLLHSYDLVSADPQVREAAFTEAADLFCALITRPEARRRLLRALAILWALPADQSVDAYEQLNKPAVQEGKAEIVVGRATLDRVRGDVRGAARAGTFARTGHSMRMMERVAVALARNEPVLLVGETGTGKTTLVSQLSAMTGQALVSFNMSAQTDSSDLLGGFKPVEARDALLPLLEPFTSLIRQTWKKGNNEEFLNRCAKYAERRKWSHLLQAFKTALAKVQAADAAAAASAEAAQPAAGSITQTGVTGSHDAMAPNVAATFTPATKKRKKHSAVAGVPTPTAPVASAALDQAGSPAKNSKKSGAGQDAAGTATAGDAATKKSSKGSEAGGESKSILTSEQRAAWRTFAVDLAAAERAAAVSEGGFAFSFVEGKLVTALRQGWWLLLDEINLAPPEVLERIAGLLEGPQGSVTLVERGDTQTVPRHPSFRLIAAMNPATDAGKRELPAALRNRLTEIWVPEPTAREDLRSLVHGYLAGVTALGGGGSAATAAAPVASSGGVTPLLQPVEACVDLYLAIRQEMEARLTDGAGQKPAYNLRTLSRALDYARTFAPQYGLQRALYDGFAMAFVTQLSAESEPRVEALLLKHLLPGMKSAKPLLRTPPEPQGGQCVLFEHFWLARGPNPPPSLGKDDDGSKRKFVLTPSVKRQLCNLARAVLIRKHPILLQGPTSAGKTSLVAYLAAQSGHTLVRINNHEHTDLQEYLGSYISDASGRLVFREGALVRAMRQGHWLVLDELNLAPSDVLEALNRLLDDNRELFVPELNEVVKPHPAFMLFATQNPPGAYAGRKALSRAFRSRFLEMHVEELPDTELSTILEQRCEIAPTYAKKLVEVMRELQRRRQATNVFAGKHGFITPRDLFRWAERGAIGYQSLAEDGCLLLGERLRSPEERQVVADVLSKIMNVKLDMEDVFNGESDAPFRELAKLLASQQQPTGSPAGPGGSEDLEALRRALRGVAWTRSMRRMYTLVERCLKHQEPVLLVGETGTGKTTVCQLLALMRGQQLHILNCNQHTETSDFLGGFRPTRGRERAVGAFVAAVHSLHASPLWQTSAIPAPSLPSSQPSPAEISTTNSQIQSAMITLSQWAASQTADNSIQPALTALQATATEANTAATAACAPFMWVDGPLVTAMRRGDMILIDEINLAEDAVLERLNSVLEPGRTLTLAERGGEGAEVVVAAPGFRILATMNPGGDYGKKELSPALTNRFTSIWVPALENQEELLGILNKQLASPDIQQEVAPRLLAFWSFFRDHIATPARMPLSVRDLLAWARFVNAAAPTLGILPAYVHGAHLVLLDGLGLGVGLPPATAAALRNQCCTFLKQQLPLGSLQLHARAAEGDMQALKEIQDSEAAAVQSHGRWGIHPFYVTPPNTSAAPKSAVEATETGSTERAAPGVAFELSAPTAARNAYRVLRALTLPKAVLLEGSPGVGKTALVAALAKRAGVPLVRINLSEQTDMMDLLGADLPAAGGQPGQFTWCDGPLLAALQQGAWVLLDELNLANQSVLEGLNALLDHRAEVFIPELGATFRCHPSFRLFAAQNPLQEGGGRKGLPRSFLNRFTRVYAEVLQAGDLQVIASALYPRLPASLLQRMVALLDAMQEAANGNVSHNSSHADSGSAGKAGVQTQKQQARRFAADGGPWEFNLRDLLRWADLVDDAVLQPSTHPGDPNSSLSHPTEAACLEQAAEHFAHMLFRNRLRTTADRAQFDALWAQAWGSTLAPQGYTPLVLTPDVACIGRAQLHRRGGAVHKPANSNSTQANISTLVSSSAQAMGSQDSARADTDMDVDNKVEEEESNESMQLEHEVEVSGQHHASRDEALHLLGWQQPLLESMAHALSRGWMVLLVGGPGSGKTRLARLAARLAGRRLTELALTAGTDTSDLLGSFEQVEPARRVQEVGSGVHHLVTHITHLLLSSRQAMGAGSPQLQHCKALQESWHGYCSTQAAEQAGGAVNSPEAHLKGVTAVQSVLHACLAAASTLPGGCPAGVQKRLQARAAELSELQALLMDEASRAVAGRFEWVDGTLSRAIARGGWVLLDNANLCNPTVLDRLNPLLEPAGSLFLAEAGTVGGKPRVIQPHPHFRLILALDPRHGEVSRAMRNRGIELFLLPPNSHTPLPLQPLLQEAQESTHTPVTDSAHQTNKLAKGAASVSNKTVPGSDSVLVSVTTSEQRGELWIAARTTIASEGAAAGGVQLLDSLADTHVAVCSISEAGHRRGPLLSDLRAWVRLTRLLLERGWLLSTALPVAWKLAYLGPVVLGVTEQQAAHQVLLNLCVTLGIDLQKPAIGQHQLGMQADSGDESEPMDIDGITDMAQSVPSQLTITDLVHVPDLVSLDCSNTGLLRSHKPARWAAPMLSPCLWPNGISGAQLADHTMGSVMRDLAHVTFAAAVSATSTRIMSDAHNPVALSNNHRAVLPWLPTQAVAEALRPIAPTRGGPPSPGAGDSTDVALAAQLVLWASVPVLLQRSLSGVDDAARCAWLGHITHQCQVLQQQLLNNSATSAAATCDLLGLASQAMTTLLSHPIVSKLRTTTTAYLQQGGAPGTAIALQPLSLMYQHAVHGYLAAAAAAAAPTSGLPSFQTCLSLWSQWQCLAVAAPQAVLQQHVTSNVDTAVAEGRASAYQLSVWRSKRPEHRALQDAPHPLIDSLAPVFARITTLEEALLTLPVTQTSNAVSETDTSMVWSEELSEAWSQLAQWRASLWSLCHGPLQIPASSELAVDGEAATWVWQKLSKAFARLCKVLGPAAASGQLASVVSELSHSLSQGAAALGLDAVQSKPLLWRHAGHPVLPRTHSLLTAQLTTTQLALISACSPAPAAAMQGAPHALDASRVLDARGYPKCLTAAGLNAEQLVEHALQQAIPYWDPHGEGAAEIRQHVATAVAGVLLCDPALREALQGGVALLAFAPVTEAMAAGHGAFRTTMSSADSNSKQLALAGEVPDLLHTRAKARAAEAAADAARLHGQTEADVSVQMSERLLQAGITAAGKQAARQAGGATRQLLLPASLMVSPACRNLQSALLKLQDLHGLRSQLPILSQLQQALVTLSLNCTQSAANLCSLLPTLTQHLPAALCEQLAHTLRSHMQHGVYGTTRPPCHFSSHQQLCWSLEALQGMVSEPHAGRPGRLVPGRMGKLTEQGAERARKAQYLVSVVLPAAVSEMWLAWHQGVWRSAVSEGMLLNTPSSPFMGGQIIGDHPPARLQYSPAHAAAASAVVLDCASAVQDRAVRVLQLRLAGAHLVHMASEGSRSRGAVQQAWLDTWQALAGLLVQILLAHVTSLPDPDAQQQLFVQLQQLLQATQQVAQQASAGSQHTSDLSLIMDLHGVTQEILKLLSHSNHALLLSLLQSLAAPALQAVADGLQSLHTLSQSSETAHSSMQAHQQQLLQGKAWVLVGALRLHLVAPPPGIDPAGKYRLKVVHAQTTIKHVISPQASVRAALLLMPGGPDESENLTHLAMRRRHMASRIQDAASRCVPRPTPPQYIPLAQEVRDLTASLASISRTTVLVNALTSPHARAAAGTAAVQEACQWVDSMGAWCDRAQQQYRQYSDVLQPVFLAVQEMRHGFGLLASGAHASPGASLEPPAANITPSAADVVGALMAFPLLNNASGGTVLDTLTSPTSCVLVAAVGAASGRAATSHLGAPAKSEKAAEMSAYTSTLQLRLVALHAASRQLLAAGPAAVSSLSTQQLRQLEQLLGSFLDQWEALKAHEERLAEEEAQMFVSKARSTHIANEEEEAEVEYQKLYPDWSAPFASVPGLDEDKNDLMRPDAPSQPSAATQPSSEAQEASDAQAQTAAARQLLDGQILSDIVRLHAAVFSQLTAAAATGAVTAHLDAETGRSSFLRSYGLGAQLLAALGPGSTQQVDLQDKAVSLAVSGVGSAVGQSGLSLTLGRQLDNHTLTGHLFRMCLEATKLSEAAASTAAAAVAAVAAKGQAGHHASDAVDTSIDIQQPCVAEIVLLQEPVGAAARRVSALLAEFPDHPVLAQLAAIAARLLNLPLDTPLKTALTGLELLLARAQVWEETAAKFVSIKSELTAVAGLATRWRRLELSSWRGTLTRVTLQHGQGAYRSWFHLYQLLIVKPIQPAVEGTELKTVAASASGAAVNDDEDKWFRRTVSTLEAFMQTSTLGEYATRLQLLASFKAHLKVRLQLLGDESEPLHLHVAIPLSQYQTRLQLLVASLANIYDYYAQFQPSIDAATKVGMAPHEKDLADFVALAKWEDRGFYAMKASTEKAQRHLHKLRRRAEEVLRQAAAGTLAQAMKSMGIGEYAAAHSLLNEPEPAVSPASAPAAATQPPAAPAAKPAAVRMVRRRKAGKVAAQTPASLLHTQPSGLEVTELQEGSDMVDPVMEPGTWASWMQACEAAKAAATAAAASADAVGRPIAVTPSSVDTETGKPQLQNRLPQLTKKMAELLSGAVRLDPTVTHLTDLETDESATVTADQVGITAPMAAAGGTGQAVELVPGAVQVDELAGPAAARAAALRLDKEKGCRLRKKKALADFLSALGDLGLSKRQSDIPRDERTVTDWFKQTPPDLSPLLTAPTPAAVIGSTAVTAAPSILTPQMRDELKVLWGKAQAYHLRSVARIQKLWSVKQDAHKDVSLAEANAAARMSEHLLLLSRRQRTALGHLSHFHHTLQRLAAWLSDTTGSTLEVTDGHTSAASTAVQALPQHQVLQWLQRQKAGLDGLEMAVADTISLLQACNSSGVCTAADQQQALGQASTSCQAWQARLTAAKQALDACACSLQLPGSFLAGGITPSVQWATASTVNTLCANYAVLSELASEAAVYQGRPAGGFLPPGMPALAEALATAAQAGSSFLAAVANSPADVTTTVAAQSSREVHEDPGVQQTAAGFGSCMEAAVSSVLIWAQGVKSNSEEAAAAATADDTSAGTVNALGDVAAPKPKALVQWTTSLSSIVQMSQLSKVVESVVAALRSLDATQSQLHELNKSGTSSSPPAASVMASWTDLLKHQQARLAGLAPLLLLAAGLLQLQSTRLLHLHKSTTKLAYITTSLFATLLEEGFCAPQEGAEAEGAGDGSGEWKEVEGTGMGEGDTRGAKDVSDKITDEDQLLGAQQKDQQPPEQQQQEQQDKMDEKDDGKGIEMDADFEGELHDLDVDKQQQDEEMSEDQEGDNDRIDQQMGDTGDKSERVDEKLWNDEDEQPEDQQQPRKEEYDEKGSIQVDDKKDLDYEAGKENPDDQQGQDDNKKEPPKKEAGKMPQKQRGPEEEMGGEEGEEEEGGVNDGQDTCQDRPEDHVQPEAPEAELELPDELNLDGEGEEEQPAGAEEQAADDMQVDGPPQEVQDEAGKQDEQEGAGVQDNDTTMQDQQAGQDQQEDEGEGGEEKPGDQQGPQEPEQQPEEDVEGAGQGGIGEVPDQEAAKEPEQDEAIEPTAAHGLGEQPPPPPEQQQAGPKGVASTAVTQQGDKGKSQRPAPQAATQQQQQQQPQQQQGVESQPEAGGDEEGREEGAPPPAQQSDEAQAPVGMSDAAQQGRPAPLSQGGAAPQTQSMQRKKETGEKLQEANPLRDLGDALERWRANLNVQHDVADQEGGGGDEDEGPQPAEDAAMSAPEYQYLGQHDTHRAGDTQALAPATEDQAKELDDAAMQQQLPDQEMGEDHMAAMDEEMSDQKGGEGDDENRPPPVAGVAPRQWQGAQRDAKAVGQEVEEDGRGDEEGGQQDGEGSEDAADALQQQMESLFKHRETAADADASLAMAQLDLDKAMEAAQVDKDEEETPMDQDDVAAVLSGLSPEQIAQLRADLDEQLRTGTASVSDPSSAEGLAAARYGSEVWSRCDALTAGLAGELTEQLRLILEPTQASRLAGDFRTGKRISMRKVIAYIASHFRKDKIWLRRSRPDKRRYQVVLAVDDSRSMAECGCGGVALEALTLLCKALSRLEVGQIGVMKFGGPEGVVPLHPLTSPFTDAAGPGIMANLRFNQDNTIADQPMLRLVEALDHLLDVARHQSGAGGIGAATQDLAQLVLIVADGRLHEKAALQARVRELSAKRGVCLVFIAIDSPAALQAQQQATANTGTEGDTDSAAAAAAAPAAPWRASGSSPAASSSLLDMQAVTFQGGKPVFKRYLDDFPWPYYVLLRDISALPHTLADLLRQWFELSAAGGTL